MKAKHLFIILMITVSLLLLSLPRVSAQTDDMDIIINQLEAEINRLKNFLSKKQLEPLNNILESIKKQNTMISRVAAKQLETELALNELKEAEDELLRVYEVAQKAYDELKSTADTEIFQSMKTAIKQTEITTGYELLTIIGRIAVKRNVEIKLAEEARKRAPTFLGFLGAAKTNADIGEWIAKDGVFISKNIKTNWLIMTQVWLAKRRYDKAKEKLLALKSSEIPFEPEIKSDQLDQTK